MVHRKFHTTPKVCSYVQLSLPLFAAGPETGNGAVRLYRNGNSSIDYTSGTVQVYYNGVWGNICFDSSFGSDEANVVCRQLGYTGASGYSNAGLER